MSEAQIYLQHRFYHFLPVFVWPMLPSNKSHHCSVCWRGQQEDNYIIQEKTCVKSYYLRKWIASFLLCFGFRKNELKLKVICYSSSVLLITVMGWIQRVCSIFSEKVRLVPERFVSFSAQISFAFFFVCVWWCPEWTICSC